MSDVLHIPGIYYRPVPEPDPNAVWEVDRYIQSWARRHDLVPPQWQESFDGFRLGWYVCACHPSPASYKHRMVAAKLLLAENIVDDCVCEDHGGSPDGLGARLLLAHSALDPSRSIPGYEKQWKEAIEEDRPWRSYRLALKSLQGIASPVVVDRERHDLARLHLGYLAEAANTMADRVPAAWEYLTLRQMNSFRPCLSIVDAVDGFELSPYIHASEPVQGVLSLASLASTLCNDLYSYTKELRCPRPHTNLPGVLAREERLSDRGAYLRAVEVHNQVMHALEEASAEATFGGNPDLKRYIGSVNRWVDGNHAWHRTNTGRYSLPGFL